ncbi:hypothetical protein COO60DRAFT_1700220 [Scenedesmus sp. NREL 46B-D3]|nr:hypothetical protein COO60DRAFT_1700220 [Scenedesmus sp. NREL 46B-D3]
MRAEVGQQLQRQTAESVYSNDNPYRLNRDLVIKSAYDTAGQLDFQFLSGKVLVGPGVTVTLENLVIRNIRKLSGFSLDFFEGDTNSTIVLRNVVRAKMVCIPIDQAYNSAESFGDVPGFPLNNISIIDNICVLAPNWTDQVCYDDSVHFQSMAVLLRKTDPGAGYSWPGYVLYMVNVTRVCDNYISGDCIATSGQDSCIADLLDRLLNGTLSSVWRPRAIAGVAVAAGVVVVAIVLCCVCRQRILLCLVRRGHKSLQEIASSSSPTVVEERAPSLLLTHSDRSNKKRPGSQTVRLGVLLGSGSFGRVYRGRWHGTDVAVKIISCTPDELTKVLKEAEVMMQLHHPNIVRAHQCSVWNPAEQQRALQAGKKAAGAAAASRQAAGRRTRPGGSSQLTSSTMPGSSSTGHGSTAAAAGGRGARNSSSVVINIMPDIVLHSSGRGAAAGNAAAAGGRRGAAARQAAAASGARGSKHGTSGTAAGPASGSAAAGHPQPRSSANRASTAAGAAAVATAEAAAAAAAANAASGSAASGGSSSVSAAARRLLFKVLHPVAQHQQQQQEAWAQQQQQQQGAQAPSTRSWSHEGYIYPQGRFAGTPLSSATPTASGAGSNGATLSASAGYSYFPRPMLPAAGDGVASRSSVPGYLSGISGSTGQQLAPSATGSSGAPVLLPVIRGMPYAPGSSGGAHIATLTVSSTAAEGEPSWPSQVGQGSTSSGGALIEGRDSRGGWWGASSWRLQRQQALQQQAVAGSTSSSATRSGPQAAEQQQQQLEGSSAAALPRVQRPQQLLLAAAAAAAKGAAADERPPGDELLAGDASSEEGRKEVQVWLVLELCTGGTLKDAVSMGKLKSQGRLEMAKLLCRLLDAATGMAYLHGKGVLHGDLKAGNVLLQSTVQGTYGQVAKISDFGLSATLLDGATHRSTASMGTITHMAPEVLRSGHMSAAADVYSFGIMMWEVYTNAQAHQGLHSGAVVERVVVRGERPAVPPDMPTEYSLLMRSCWDADASKRPTFAQVIQCLELLLDNLTSDSDGRISEESEGAHSTSSNSGNSSGRGGNASGGYAHSSIAMEGLLARRSAPHAAAQVPEEAAFAGRKAGAAGSSAAAADIAAGRPEGLLGSPWLAAAGLGLAAATPAAPQPPDRKQLQLVSLADKAMSDCAPSGPSTSSAAIGRPPWLDTVLMGRQTGGTWSSSLGGSGSMGSTLGVPATPQQPTVQQQQQEGWQQVGRHGLRQQQAEFRSGKDAGASQLVQDL